MYLVSILSSFLLGGILLDHARAPGLLGTFYLRRACRILPLYWVLLALFSAGTWLFAKSPSFLASWLFGGRDALPLWTYFTFTQNFAIVHFQGMGAPAAAPTWSLAVEEQFYLVLPWLMLGIPRRWLPPVLILLIAGAVGVRVFLYQHHPGSGFAGHHLLPSRMDTLLLGVLGAWIHRSPWCSRRLSGSAPLRNLTLLVLLLGTVALGCLSPAMGSAGMAWGGYTWMAVFYLCLVLFTLHAPSGVLARFFRLSWLRWLGVRSYGLYLLHQAVVGTVFILAYGHAHGPPEPGDWFVSLVALAVLLLLASASWRWLETPFLRLGRRRAYGLAERS
jgi:peptidoglycan/LPS O-acetylase OafA/YrhL